MILDQAQRLADEMVALLKPYCERVEIGGSVRRRKADVKDIEIVCMPKCHTEIVPDLFGTHEEKVNELARFFELVDHKGWTLALNGDRQKKLQLRAGIAVDLFIVLPPAQWGYILAIRTGPAEYSKLLVTPRKFGGFLPSHLKCIDGGVYEGKRLIETPEEKDFYRVLGLDWLEPYKRNAELAFRKDRGIHLGHHA